MMHKLINNYNFNDSLVQYGDGLFETMLAINNSIHHWDYHWQRLQKSCNRLQISIPKHAILIKQLQDALAKHNNKFSIVKMIVSRGDGLRGYRSYARQASYVQFSIYPYQFDAALYKGFNLRICKTKLSHQPLLAGIKHTNCLEYIMARREVNDGQFDEGLLLNYDGNLIEGLVSNVFIINSQQIYTPDLSNSGVLGTMRAYLLDVLPILGYKVKVDLLTLEDLKLADEIFLTNAILGIVPVTCVDKVKKKFSKTITDYIRSQVSHPCSK